MVKAVRGVSGAGNILEQVHVENVKVENVKVVDILV